MNRELPAGAWQALLPRALVLIGEIRRHGGITDPFWTLGGGTVLMFRHRHRLSKDIDIFVPNPQYLGFVTPRLSDVAASLTGDYSEDPSAWVKLQFEEGEVDFVAAPNLLDNAREEWTIDGQCIRVETSAEIIAKKMFHRGHRTTARDLFDPALVIEREPDTLVRHRSTFLDQIRNPHPTLKIAFNAIDTLDYTPDFDHCVAIAGDYLEGL
ncbi:nucleotidyl transferase AbiEii/AbiGii toxin family protein [Stenotrophomonas sp. CC120223-11]|uniref:nucleotidyl transferase AbiEii/AbiGii toxin family protein n=1 Tax=Stenotrophomonas sp. CC120223-11 TaxID=1378090 RepID=UPI000BE2BEDB|nr:nucleotidyl transferase AbiEii/AbiGii toxin family protein [Stenotrophomonas sp. CC120223-11]